MRRRAGRAARRASRWRPGLGAIRGEKHARGHRCGHGARRLPERPRLDLSIDVPTPRTHTAMWLRYRRRRRAWPAGPRLLPEARIRREEEADHQGLCGDHAEGDRLGRSGRRGQGDRRLRDQAGRGELAKGGRARPAEDLQPDGGRRDPGDLCALASTSRPSRPAPTWARSTASCSTPIPPSPKFTAIFSATLIETLKAWQAFHLVDNAAPYLSDRFVQARFAFRNWRPGWPAARSALAGSVASGSSTACPGRGGRSPLCGPVLHPGRQGAKMDASRPGGLREALPAAPGTGRLDEPGDPGQGGGEALQVRGQDRLSGGVARLARRWSICPTISTRRRAERAVVFDWERRGSSGRTGRSTRRNGA